MAKPPRILVRTPNWVGDAVMALPFLSSLRLNAPDSEIHLLTGSSLVDFYAQVSACNKIIAIDETRGRHGLFTLWRNARMLRPTGYDIAFCLPPSFGSALMMYLAGIRRRVGYASDRRGWLLTDSLPYLPNGKRPHRAEGFLSLLSLVWSDAELDRSLQYNLGRCAAEEAAVLWPRESIPKDAPILAIAPGAAQPNKIWPSERFAEISRLWLAQSPAARVVIIGGAGDKEICDFVQRALPSERVHNLCGAGSLPLVGAIIQRAVVFLGNDSGLSHLAAAVGAPVVVISGPGDPAEVSPFVKAAITVKKSLFCSPCYRNYCYRKDIPLECQLLVTVADVWVAVNRQFSSSQTRPNTR